jgi:sugar phosphate isomerase/epimerase
MKLDREHLTYCTNIHPARGFTEVWESLKHHTLPLKASLSPDAPFGIGLRLSGEESRELLGGDTLARFKAWLDAHGLYVFTMNGFPHGPFHGQAVKAQVHAPDWRSDERVDYTLRLAQSLAELLPAGVTGGISTSPLSYKAWVDEGDAATWRHLTENVVRVAEYLAKLRAEQGVLIHLDLEPEPDGLLENSRELAAFFERWLLRYGAEMLAKRLGIPEETARETLLTHVQVCFDTCHVALAYEDPAEVLARFDGLGIRVGKVQLSSALELTPQDADATRRNLEPFNEPVYLHQVIQQGREGGLTRFPDLPDALAALPQEGAERWRVHFHVPIFLARTDAFATTQRTILETLELHRQRPFAEHFEVETYTWSILPEALKLDLTASIERELRWAQGAL